MIVDALFDVVEAEAISVVTEYVDFNRTSTV